MQTTYKVGDKVRVTSDIDEHKIGNVRIINRIKSPSGRFDYGLENGGYIDEQYIELVLPKPTKNQRISSLEQAVEALQAEVEALKAAKKAPTVKVADAVKPTPNEQASANEKRKAIIDEAKAFVEEYSGVVKVDTTPYTTGAGSTTVKLFVNKEKRIVTAIPHLVHANYTCHDDKKFAKCAPDDVFNADIGKAIALGRALGLDVSKFEKAAQPSEVVVGQVVKGREETGRSDFEESVTGMFPSANDRGHGTAFHHSGGLGWLGEKQVHIINDSEAQY